MSARDRPVAAALATAGVVTVAFLAGRPAAVSLAVGSATVAVLARHSVSTPVPAAGGSDRRTDALLPPLLGLVLLAAGVARGGHPFAALLVQGVALAGAIGGRSRPAVALRLRWTVERAADVVGRVIARIAFTVIGLAFVLLPWALQRAARWDPTWFRRLPGSRLVAIRDQPLDFRRQWSSTVDARRPGVRRRLHAVALVVVVLLAVGLPVAVASRDGSIGDPVGDPDATAALDGSPWWDDARPAQMATYDEATVTGFVGPVLADVRTEYTNVVDGRRVSWHPPAATEVTVWVFGGSTAFGLGQRDDHTIPSELARVAWDDGVAVDVVNWGVHGDVHWMEWNRVRNALAGGVEPPDLVVFYDGFNDLATFNYINNLGRVAGRPYLGSLDSGTIERSGLVDRILRRVATSFEDRGLEPERPSTTLSPLDVADAAAHQFETSVAESRRGLAELGIPSVVFYQPSRVTRAEPVPGEGDDGDEFRSQEQAFRRRLPDDVVDLSDALDGVAAPVYWDGAHHNEAASRVIARRMYDNIADDVRAATGGRG